MECISYVAKSSHTWVVTLTSLPSEINDIILRANSKDVKTGKLFNSRPEFIVVWPEKEKKCNVQSVLETILNGDSRASKNEARIHIKDLMAQDLLRSEQWGIVGCFDDPVEHRFHEMRKMAAEQSEDLEVAPGQDGADWQALALPHWSRTLVEFRKLRKSWMDLANKGCNEEKQLEERLALAKGGPLSDYEKGLVTTSTMLQVFQATAEHHELGMQLVKELPVILWATPPTELAVLTCVKDVQRRLAWMLRRAKHLELPLEKEPKNVPMFLKLFRQTSVYGDDYRARGNRMAAAKDLWKTWTGLELKLSESSQIEADNVNKGLLDHYCKHCERPLSAKVKDFCSKRCRATACKFCKQPLLDTGIMREKATYESSRNKYIYRRLDVLKPFCKMLHRKDCAQATVDGKTGDAIAKIIEQSKETDCCAAAHAKRSQPVRGVMNTFCQPCRNKVSLQLELATFAKKFKSGELCWDVCKEGAAECSRLEGASQKKRIMKCPQEENGRCPEDPKRRRVA